GRTLEPGPEQSLLDHGYDPQHVQWRMVEVPVTPFVAEVKDMTPEQWFDAPSEAHEYFEQMQQAPTGTFEPVIVDEYGDMIDGFHRAYMAALRGEETIKAWQAFDPRYAKTSMAESTGDPTLDKLIEEFMVDPGYDLQMYRNPGDAEGNCANVSEYLVNWLRTKGIKASLHDPDNEYSLREKGLEDATWRGKPI